MEGTDLLSSRELCSLHVLLQDAFPAASVEWVRNVAGGVEFEVRDLQGQLRSRFVIAGDVLARASRGLVGIAREHAVPLMHENPGRTLGLAPGREHWALQLSLL